MSHKSTKKTRVFFLLILNSIFWSIFGDRMTNLGLIDFKIGMYIKVNVNLRQNKFKVHINQFGQSGHLLAHNRPDATLAHGHYLAITW